MNKQTKIIVTILALVLILLILATVSFSMEISKHSATLQTDASDSAVNADGNEIIQGESQLYGVADAAGNIRIEPDWEQLHFIGTEYLSAAKETEEGQRIGVLDLDGNVIAPFVYTEVHALTPSYYLAAFAESDQVVIYDSAFRATESTVWDGYSWENQQLTLSKGEDSFVFSLEDDQMTLKQLNVSRSAKSFSFALSCNRGDMTTLSSSQWSDIADKMLQFLQMVRGQAFTNLQEVTDAEQLASVQSAITTTEASISSLADTLFVSTETDNSGKTTVRCRIGLTVYSKTDGAQQKTLSAQLEQDTQEIWMITAAQIG